MDILVTKYCDLHVCMLVYLFILSLLAYLKNHMSKLETSEHFQYVLNVAVAWCSSDDMFPSHPVLWMTSCFNEDRPNYYNHRDCGVTR